jgi:putative nucleotidyltransferase with HDIG domain
MARWRLSLSTKNLVAVSILTVVLVGLGFLAVRAQDAAMTDLRAGYNQVMAMYYLGQIRGDLAELRVDQFRAASLGASGPAAEAADAAVPRRELSASLEELGYHVLPSDHRAYALLRRDAAAFAAQEDQVFALLSRGKVRQAYALLNGTELARYRFLQNQVHALSSLIRMRNEAALTALERETAEFRWGLLAGGGVLLFLVLLQAAMVHWTTAVPMRRLARAAREVAAGRLDLQVPVLATRDEVESLSADFGRMLEELRSDWRRLNRLRESAVMALANAVEAKDHITGGHSDGMAADAARLAEQLGLAPEEAEAVRWGGILHDVGKIGIPGAVLNKQGLLDEAEWEVMRRHPVIGAGIVARMEGMERVVPIVRHHHEHYDGSGYPEGRRGEDIPLGARIVGVVDAFHALQEERPYRPAFSREEAMAVLRRGAGTLWDPQVLAALERLWGGSCAEGEAVLESAPPARL